MMLNPFHQNENTSWDSSLLWHYENHQNWGIKLAGLFLPEYCSVWNVLIFLPTDGKTIPIIFDSNMYAIAACIVSFSKNKSDEKLITGLFSLVSRVLRARIWCSKWQPCLWLWFALLWRVHFPDCCSWDSKSNKSYIKEWIFIFLKKWVMSYLKHLLSHVHLVQNHQCI